MNLKRRGVAQSWLFAAAAAAILLLGRSPPVFAAGSQWSTTASYPGASGSMGEQMCADATGYIYCVGGIGGDDLTVDSSYYAQLSSSGGISGGWQQTTSYPPGGISTGSCVTYDGYIDCFGGWCTDSSASGPCFTIQGPNYLDWSAPISSSGIGAWTGDTNYPPIIVADGGIAAAPIVGDAYLSCAQYNGWVYCVGGMTEVDVVEDGSLVQELTPTASVVFAQLSSSGGITGDWYYANSYGGGTVYDTSCNASNGYLYCVGGDIDSNPGSGSISGVVSAASTSPTSEVWSIPINSDGSLGTWNQQTNYGGGSADGLGCAIQGGFVFCTGNNSDETWFSTIDYGNVGSWATTSAYPASTYDPDCLSDANGYVYCIGGNTDTVADDLLAVTVDDQATCQTIGGTWTAASGSAAAKCTIESGGTLGLTLSGGVTLVVNGLLFVDGTITVGSTGALTTGPSGLIYNYGSITVDNGGALYNDAGTIVNQDGGSIVDFGAFSNYEAIQNSGTISVDTLTAFNNYGTFDNLGGTLNVSILSNFSNAGTFENDGTVSVSASTFTNSGTYYGSGAFSMTIGKMDNSGSMEFDSGGQTITLGNSGIDGSRIDSTGTITDYATILVDQYGAIDNEVGGTFTDGNNVTLASGSTFSNYGTFDDGVPNTGSGLLYEFGDFDNYGTFTIDQGQITLHAGTFDNEAGGVLNSGYNSAEDYYYNFIYNPGGTIINQGTINDGGAFENEGTFTSEGGTMTITLDADSCASWPLDWSWTTELGDFCVMSGNLNPTIPNGVVIVDPDHVALETDSSSSDSLSIASGGTLQVAGDFFDDGPVTIYGPSGTVQLTSTGSWFVDNDAVVTNMGTISNAGQISNGETMVDYCGSHFTGNALEIGSNALQHEACSLNTDPASGKAGTTVQVSASTFWSGDTSAEVYYDGNPVCLALVSGGSLGQCEFDVPTGSAGSYPVSAVGSPGGDSISGTFSLVTSATTSLSSLLSEATVSLGTGVTDTATLSGGNDPGGSISFFLYSDSACSDQVSGYSSTVPVSGNGEYTSRPFSPSSPGTYYWKAVYGGDSSNLPSSTTCGAATEVLTVVKATPSVTTQVVDESTGLPPSGSLAPGTSFHDTAVVAGVSGVPPTGGLVYQFFDSGACSGPPATTSPAVVAGSIASSASTGPLGAGSYAFDALYSGDSNYNAAVSACETFTVQHASPTLSTTPSSPSVTLGTGTPTLSDSALLSGGYSETGTITFRLLGPGGALVDAETVTVTGNGVYNTPTGYALPTSGVVAGSYQWDASYSGDANNNPATDNSAPNELVQVLPAQPSIATTPSQSSLTLGTTAATLADSATLSGGWSPTGTLTFVLTAPGGAVVDTETVAVTGDGVFVTPTGYTLPSTGTVAGTYQWSASYSGDGNNQGASSVPGAEPVVVNPASPSIETSASQTTITLDGPSTAVAMDAATISGGYFPSGAITFTLYPDAACSASPVDLETVPVTGDGSYSTVTGYQPAAPGTYQWVASYSGDANNAPSTSPCGATGETFTVLARTTSTSLTCTPTAVDQPSSCTATVTDTDTGAPVTPTGTVDTFTDGGTGGTFGSSSCSLTGGACSFTYTPPPGSESGPITISVTYEGDSVHLGSSGSTSLTPTVRTTSTSVSCPSSPVDTASPASCTVTVSDDNAGTATTPTGTVSVSSVPAVSSLGLPSSCSLTPTSTTGIASCGLAFTPGTGSQASYTVTASYAGDTDHGGSSGSGGLTVEQPGTTAQGSSTTTMSGGGASSNQDSSTGVSVTITGSSSPDGTSVTITTEQLSSPSTDVGVSGLLGTKYYDVTIIGITGGTAQVCITSSTPVHTIEYWNGHAWVKATGITVTGDTICGDIPVSALSGTNIVVGDPRTDSMTLACSPSFEVVGYSTPTIYCIATVTDTSSSPVNPTGEVAFAVTSPSSPPSALNFPPSPCDLVPAQGSSSTAQCSLAPFTPAAGSQGDYTITATYSGDLVQAGGSTTYELTVYTPAGATEGLISVVNGMNLLPQVTRSLDLNLYAAAASLDHGDTAGAVGQLDAFLNSVSFQSGKQIPSADAQQLASDGQAIVVALTIPTTTSVSCSPSTGHQPFGPQEGAFVLQCTATVAGGTGQSSPTGAVSWGTTSPTGSFQPQSCFILYAGACIVQYVDTSAGTITITANYAGDLANAPSSGTTTVTLSPSPTSTSVSCSHVALGPEYPYSAICTATVAGSGGTPTGNVAWSTTSATGSFVPMACRLDARGTCSVEYSDTSMGAVTITASYGGDVADSPSSGTTSFTIPKAATETSLYCGPPGQTGRVVTCTVTVFGDKPSGVVTFGSSSGGSFSQTSCTLVVSPEGSECHVTYTASSAGTVTITATYSGDGDNQPSSGTFSVTFR